MAIAATDGYKPTYRFCKVCNRVTQFWASVNSCQAHGEWPRKATKVAKDVSESTKRRRRIAARNQAWARQNDYRAARERVVVEYTQMLAEMDQRNNDAMLAWRKSWEDEPELFIHSRGIEGEALRTDPGLTAGVAVVVANRGAALVEKAIVKAETIGRQVAEGGGEWHMVEAAEAAARQEQQWEAERAANALLALYGF